MRAIGLVLAGDDLVDFVQEDDAVLLCRLDCLPVHLRLHTASDSQKWSSVPTSQIAANRDHFVATADLKQE